MCSVCKNVICPAECPQSYNTNTAKSKYEVKKRPAFFDGFANRSDIYEPVSQCDACGLSLYPGDTATIIEDYVLCEDCLSEATVILTPEGVIRDE